MTQPKTKEELHKIVWKRLTLPQKKLLQGLYVTRKRYFVDYYPPVQKLSSILPGCGLIEKREGMYYITELGDAVYEAGLDEST